MAEPVPIHTLVFDLDDTLYPEKDFVLSGFDAVDRWLNERRSVKGFAEVAGEIFSCGRRGRIFDEALPMIGVEPTADLIAELVSVYRAHEPSITLFPEAQEILGWAAPRFKLGLITDGYGEVQTRKIRALGLETVIPCRVITDELGRAYWKPSPEPYRRVMSRHAGRAKGFLYVGDNPRKDFVGARSLGWQTMRIRRATGEHAAHESAPAEAADCEIESLLKLKVLLS